MDSSFKNQIATTLYSKSKSMIKQNLLHSIMYQNLNQGYVYFNINQTSLNCHRVARNKENPFSLFGKEVNYINSHYWQQRETQTENNSEP